MVRIVKPSALIILLTALVPSIFEFFSILELRVETSQNIGLLLTLLVISQSIGD